MTKMVNLIKKNLDHLAKGYNELYDGKASFSLLSNKDGQEIDLMLDKLKVIIESYNYALKLDSQGKKFKLYKK